MNKKILIVEDDKLLREMMSRKLKKEGFEVFIVTNGEDGEEKVREAKPDVILLDLILPGISGFEVLERVKKDEELKHIHVIILSNLGQKSEIQKGKDLGAEDFLVKAHFTPAEVVEKIKTLTNS